MKVLHIITEGIFPILLYVLFTWYLISSSIKAFKATKKIKRESVTVPARITDYYEKKSDNGAFRYKEYFVTVSCKHPDSKSEEEFTLGTTSIKGKRYADISETDVIFLTADDDRPVLREELNSIKRVRFTALFGGLFCTAFLTLVLVGLILVFTTGRPLADFF